MMERFHLVRRVFGGSDVLDEQGNQVEYSLPRNEKGRPYRSIDNL